TVVGEWPYASGRLALTASDRGWLVLPYSTVRLNILRFESRVNRVYNLAPRFVNHKAGWRIITWASIRSASFTLTIRILRRLTTLTVRARCGATRIFTVPSITCYGRTRNTVRMWMYSSLDVARGKLRGMRSLILTHGWLASTSVPQVSSTQKR